VVSVSNDRLTVIVRTASPERLSFLDEALFSLSVQTFENVEVLVMVQSPDTNFIETIDTIIRNIFWPQGKIARAFSVEVASGVDGRAHLLNEGLKRATGRYIAFLDDDDVVYQKCYETLITELRQSGVAIAVGGCRVAYLKECNAGNDSYFFITRKERFDRRNNHRTKFDLFYENFIPIHSYVLDGSMIADEDLYFNESLQFLEDREFLIRMAAKHTLSLTKMMHPVCEYRHHSGNSLYGREKVAGPELMAANEAIEALTERVTFPISKKEMESLQQLRTPNFFWARSVYRFDRWVAGIWSKEYIRYKLRKWRAR